MYVTYRHTSTKIWNFTPETQYSFLLSCIDGFYHINYGLKSQQMVLHANLQSEMVLTMFTILESNHIQQLIILKVIMIETRCLQF